MSQIFISYARKDQNFVIRLAQDLRQKKVDLWLDQFDITADRGRWDDQVQFALETCPHFLVVLSPSSVASQNVKDEINYALDENKTIIPVLYQSCEIPFRIRRFHRVDFRGNYEEALTELLQLLSKFSLQVVASAPKPNVVPQGRAIYSEEVSEVVEKREKPQSSQISAGKKGVYRLVLWFLRSPYKYVMGFLIILLAGGGFGWGFWYRAQSGVVANQNPEDILAANETASVHLTPSAPSETTLTFTQVPTSATTLLASPTLRPTNTSTSSPTSIPTPPSRTPTSTATATSSSTPSLTPTASDTATITPTFTITPTPAPTPIYPDAEVIASNGIDFRVGPGRDDGYGLVETLPQLPEGTLLNNLRPVVGKKDWMQAVVINPETSEPITGFVAIAPETIQINVKLVDEPPIYEFGPKPLIPQRGASVPLEEPRDFSWTECPLEEHQYYSVFIFRDDLTVAEACYHQQTKDTVVSIKPEEYGCTQANYYWGVGIVTDLTEGEGDKRKWRDDSVRNERFPLGIGQSHPAQQSTSGGGGGTGGGSTPDKGPNPEP